MEDAISVEIDATIKALDKSNAELLKVVEDCKKIQDKNKHLLDEMRKQRQHDNEVLMSN